MTNLKKVLSLVLVFAMALGLMMSASAIDVSDWDDIENQEAAQLLDSLNIMSGHADGTFDPDGILTRAQVAKMIYVARTGGVDDGAALYKGSSNTFADTKGHWAEGYINYAFTKEFVTGRGNNLYVPNATITGFELLKITLTALGFDAETEGLVGSNWKANVAALAQESGLTEGYTADPNAPITRDDAAGVFSNLIYAQTVQYDDGVADSLTTPAFGVRFLNLIEYKGILTANEYAGLGTTATKGYSIIAKAGNSEFSDATITVPAVADTDLIGYNVTALCRVSGSKITKVYSVVETVGMNNVMTSSPDYDGNSATNWQDAIVGPPSVAAAISYTNFALTPNGAGASDDGDIANGAGNGNKYLAIDNDNDGKYELEMIVDYTFARVGSVASTYKYLGAAKVEATKAMTGYDEIAKGDWVVYYSTPSGFYFIDKVEPITGTLSAYNASVAVVDGVNYKAAVGGINNADFTLDISVPSNVTVLNGYLNLSRTYWVYNGAIITSVGDTGTSNFAYLIATTSSGFVNQAKVVLDSGETAVYTVSATSPVGFSSLPVAGGVVYGYYFGSDGSINFTTAYTAAGSTNASVSYTNGNNKLGSYVVDSNTVVFIDVVASAAVDVWVVYKGIGNIPSIAGGSAAAEAQRFDAVAGLGNVLKAVAVKDSATPSTPADNYYVVTSLPTNIMVNNVLYTSFQAFDGSDVNTYTMTSGLSVAPGNVYEFSFSGDKVTGVDLIEDNTSDLAKGFVRYADDYTISLTHGNTGSTTEADAYAITSSTKYYVIDNTLAAYGIVSVAEATADDVSVYANELINDPTVVDAATDYNIVLVTTTPVGSYERVTHVFIFKANKD